MCLDIQLQQSDEGINIKKQKNIQFNPSTVFWPKTSMKAKY